MESRILDFILYEAAMKVEPSLWGELPRFLFTDRQIMSLEFEERKVSNNVMSSNYVAISYFDTFMHKQIWSEKMNKLS